MKKLRITVMKITTYPELSERYETPQPFPCSIHEGDVFYADGWQKPDGFCDSAWQTLSPFALALSHGAEGDVYKRQEIITGGNYYGIRKDYCYDRRS